MKTLVKMNFDPDIAKEVSTDAAIIFENIAYWIDKNYQNQKNRENQPSFKEGRWWTYNSVSAFEGQFIWLTARQIEKILKKLEEKDLIRSGNFNKTAYDRTKWYAVGDSPFTKSVKSIYANGEMETTKRLNGNTQSVEPIPNNNTDYKREREEDLSQTLSLSNSFKKTLKESESIPESEAQSPSNLKVGSKAWFSSFISDLQLKYIIDEGSTFHNNLYSRYIKSSIDDYRHYCAEKKITPDPHRLIRWIKQDKVLLKYAEE